MAKKSKNIIKLPDDKPLERYTVMPRPVFPEHVARHYPEQPILWYIAMPGTTAILNHYGCDEWPGIRLWDNDSHIYCQEKHYFSDKELAEDLCAALNWGRGLRKLVSISNSSPQLPCPPDLLFKYQEEA